MKSPHSVIANVRHGISISIGVAAMLVVSPVSGQRASGVTVCSHGNVSEVGRIDGRLVADSTGEPIARRVVWLQADTTEAAASRQCIVSAAADGTYRLDSIPVGSFWLFVADGGYRYVPPRQVTVTPDTVIIADFRLRPGDLIADCLDRVDCARLIVRRVDLYEAMFLATLALIRGPGADNEDWTPCLEDADVDMIARIRQVVPEVKAATACDVRDGYARKLVFDRDTGADGYLFRVGEPEFIGADEVTVKSSYYVGPLWAAGWSCRYELANSEWRVTWCRMDWIS